MRLIRPKTNARVYGRPTRNKLARRHVAAYRATPLWVVGACWLAVIAVASSVASANGFTVWGTVVGLLAVAAAIHVGAHRPEETATVVVLVLFAPVWIRVAVLYSLSSTGSASMGTTWFVFAALTLGVGAAAHQSSRGRPWVTVLLALAAITVLGPLTLMVWPRGGFLIASVYAAAVLLIRSRAWPLLVDTVIDGVHGLRSTWGSSPDPDGFEWARGADGEKRTGTQLASLPHGFVVFHDRAVAGVDENVDHLVIGPTGVYVLTSQKLSGAVVSDPDLGLMFNNATMTGVLTDAINRSDKVARELGLRRADVTTLYVVHGATLEAPRQVARLLNAADAALGEVTVLAPEEVLAEINTPLVVHSPTVVNALRRRAARKLPSFDAPAPLTVPSVTAAETADRS